MRARIYRNEDARRIIAFVPKGHSHVRVILELSDQTLILQEATVAAIVRAYISVVTHPTRRAVELVHQRLTGRKPMYAEHQLIESARTEEDILAEAEEVWRNAAPTGEQGEQLRGSEASSEPQR